MKKIIFVIFVIIFFVIFSQTDRCKNLFRMILDVIDEARRDIVGVQDTRDNTFETIYNYYHQEFQKENNQ